MKGPFCPHVYFCIFHLHSVFSVLPLPQSLFSFLPSFFWVGSPFLCRSRVRNIQNEVINQFKLHISSSLAQPSLSLSPNRRENIYKEVLHEFQLQISSNYEVRYTEKLEEYGEIRDDRRMTKQNASNRRDFFEHFQNEGTSTDFGTSVGKNINIQIVLDL